MDVQDQNVRSSDLSELVHRRGDLLLLDHGADGDPALLLELCYRGGALAGGDGGGLAELVAGDVVLAEHEPLGGDDATDARGDQLDQLWL